MYGIESYQLEASSGLVSCPQMCPSNASGPCRCSGLTAEMDGNITITATTCGDQQGLPAVVYLTPRGKLLGLPEQVTEPHPQSHSDLMGLGTKEIGMGLGTRLQVTCCWYHGTRNCYTAPIEINSCYLLYGFSSYYCSVVYTCNVAVITVPCSSKNGLYKVQCHALYIPQ